MSFWSGETLEIRLPGLIEGFSRDQIDCAAYTLRVGSEVFISPSTAVEAATKTKLLLKEDEGFAIPPGQFALVLTEESVEVPKSAVAFISIVKGGAKLDHDGGGKLDHLAAGRSV